MLQRAIYRQRAWRIIYCKSRGVPRLFHTKCNTNVQFGKCISKQYRVAPLRRLVKSRSLSGHDDRTHIESKTLSDLVRVFGRYLQLLPQMMKAVMSGSCETRELCPPAVVKGMTKLDRNAFEDTVLIPALRIPLKSIKHISKILKPYFLKMPKVKPIAELSNADPGKEGARLVLLNPEKCACADDIPEEVKTVLEDNGVRLDNFEFFALDLKYENWNVSEVLRAILPDDAENVSGFSIIGHIAHLNLKPEVEDYKFLIGEVILDKTPGIRTVVNKLNIIDNTFRNFQMELLAGEDNYVTIARENGCAFKFDFSKVYWNPRLGTEHQRIVDLINKDDIVFDVFAGVGPFAIPAAKKSAAVFANDLNPNSFSAMKENVTLNKVKKPPQLYNMDGREFIRTVVKDKLLDHFTHHKETESLPPKIHIVMNLPALALDFLDTFRGLCEDSSPEEIRNLTQVKLYPTVHCYCFSKTANPNEDVRQRAEDVLGTKLSKDDHVRYVRNVAPSKEMMCVVFTLTPDILFGESLKHCEEPDAKRSRLN